MYAGLIGATHPNNVPTSLDLGRLSSRFKCIKHFMSFTFVFTVVNIIHGLFNLVKCLVTAETRTTGIC